MSEPTPEDLEFEDNEMDDSTFADPEATRSRARFRRTFELAQSGA